MNGALRLTQGRLGHPGRASTGVARRGWAHGSSTGAWLLTAIRELLELLVARGHQRVEPVALRQPSAIFFCDPQRDELASCNNADPRIFVLVQREAEQDAPALLPKFDIAGQRTEFGERMPVVRP